MRGHDQGHVQLVAVDHECLFGVVLYAYGKVLGGAHRSLLHRAVLSLDFKPDSDEVNRLRKQQARLREVGAEAALIADLEARIEQEHGRGRSASALAKLEVDAVRDAGIRWSVVGKRGAPIRMSPELYGLLRRLFEAEPPGLLGGTENPTDARGAFVFAADPGAGFVYRPPGSVLDAYRALSFVDRPSLDAAVDAVVGEGPDAEETATWLENDFEALTARYEFAAAKGLGLLYRGS